MECYYLPGSVQVGEKAAFGPEESRHISRSKRHRTGDHVIAVNGCGMMYEIELSELRAERVEGYVLSATQGRGEPRVRVTLAQAVLKGDHLAEVVEAATQLGVAEVVPFRSMRTIGRFSARRAERLRKVALEAMKCSQRSMLPEVHEAIGFEELVVRCKESELTLVAWENEPKQALGARLIGRPGSVTVVVGPEGGFEPTEVEMLRQVGAKPVSLGPRPMRAKLAGTVALAGLMTILEEMGPCGQERTPGEARSNAGL